MFFFLRCDWDFVVSSITHMILDGYYRTLTGFQVLIEKEWINFGFVKAETKQTPPPKKKNQVENPTPQKISVFRTSFFFFFFLCWRNRFGCPYKLAHGKQTDDEQSPAFQMFCECVWIMMQQYPIHFQFTEDLLVFVLDSLYSCKYGTFLPACERERDAIKPYTVSAWSGSSSAKKKKKKKKKKPRITNRTKMQKPR